MRNILVIALFQLFVWNAGAQHLSQAGKVEKITSAAIKRSYQSSVKISPYDTLKRRPVNGVFSGVVVSAEGHVLTAAHATKPKQAYQLTFPDGRKAIAMGLGRIAVKNKEYSMDLAMLKITEKGSWPFAELGSSKQMKIYQPAISISGPGSFSNKTPNVRIGRLTNVDFEDGYFETTCKMEPGDSGGPVFDADGRVLGIHSFIKVGEESNFEIPVDLYRKYWSALNVAEDYKSLPAAESFTEVPGLKNSVTISHIQDLLKVPSKLTTSTYRLKSSVKGEFTRALATLVSYNHEGRNGVYLLSKSSLLGDTVMVLNQDRWEPLKVVTRDEDNDLVLLQAVSGPGMAIQLGSVKDTLKVGFDELGKFLVSNLDKGRSYVSSLGSRYIDMPLKKSNIGYFGANATFIKEMITITDISRGSPASRYLKLKDQVTSINGTPVSRPEHYGAELSKFKPGDSITVDVIREDKPMQVSLRLTDYSKSGSHVADRFDGGKSERSTGFSKVLIHDAAIFPEDCGGPVWDESGNFYGINIARHSRTSAVIMPASVITKFITKYVQTI